MPSRPPSAADAAKSSLALIGAGRAGVPLAAALVRAGHPLVAIASRTPGSIERARPWLAGADPAKVSAASALVEAEITLIAVPDDSLPSLVQALGEDGRDLSGRTVIHVSGRYGTAVLAPLTARGAAALAIHPAMAFAGDPAADIGRIAAAHFAVTATCAEDQARAEALVRNIGGIAFTVAEADRPLYHAALAHGANHLVTLVVQAGEMLRAAGVEAPAQVLAPLLDVALHNALARGPAGATGPVVRGDAQTVRRHLAVIAQRRPDAEAAYRTMSLASLRIAEEAQRINSDQARLLMAALAGEATDQAAEA